jgi:hypothetical protein
MPLFGWLILAFLIAVLLAAVHGVKSAYRSIRGRYRAKRNLARDFVAAGIAPRAATTGKRAGMAVAATVTGPGITWRAFLDGLRRGWRVGKRWTEIQRTRRRREREAAAADPPTAGAPPPAEPVPATAAPPTPAVPAAAAPAAPTGTPAPTPTPSTTKGTTTVPIETKTNGEIRTRDALELELKARVKEAVDELEAAKADTEAVDEEVTCVDNIVASLAEFEISDETRKAVMAMVGPTMAQKSAHQQRFAAAEAKRAATQNALDTFLESKQTRFHANAS